MEKISILKWQHVACCKSRIVSSAEPRCWLSPVHGGCLTHRRSTSLGQTQEAFPGATTAMAAALGQNQAGPGWAALLSSAGEPPLAQGKAHSSYRARFPRLPGLAPNRH